MTDHQEVLRDFKPRLSYFVGIDSDGCTFDTMELKHKECFIPNIVKYYELQAISKYAREAAEFVNLYSEWRGINRFPALVMVFKLLQDRPEVQRRGVEFKEFDALERFIESGKPLGNPSLKEELEATTMEMARKIAAGPPIAIRLSKLMLYQGLDFNLEAAMKMEAVGETITLTSQDHGEGTAAFRESRRPKYEGR